MIVSIVHQTLMVLLGVLLFARCGCGEPVQFCRMGAYDRSDSCIALSSFYNGTSHSYNLNMHFSVKFEGDEGWASIGTGDTMEDSLMFIIYPSRDKKDVTLSVRTTKLHNPPQILKDPPKYTVIQSSVSSTGYYDLQVVCHTCETWGGGTAINFASEKAHFIHAAYVGGFKSSDNGEKMNRRKHPYYGRFYVNMPKIRSIDAKIPEIIDNGRKSILGDSDGHGEVLEKASHWLWPAHGLILSTVYLVCMPAGAFTLRGGVQRAFALHWRIQMTSAAFSIVAMGIGLLLAWGHPFIVSTAGGVHKLVGLGLFFAVVTQPLLGYIHHTRYLRIKGPTLPGYVHKYMGRVLLPVGWMNIQLGLYIAGQPYWTGILAFALTVAAAVSLIFSLQIVQYAGKYQMLDPGSSKLNVLEASDFELDPDHDHNS